MLQRYRLLGLLLQRLAEVKEEVEVAVTKNSPLEKHTDIEPRLREKWEDELAAAVESEYRRKRQELLVGLEWWLRDVWLTSSGMRGELSCFASLAGPIGALAKRISVPEARENIAVMEQTIGLLNTNVQETLALEVGFLRLKL